MSLRAMECDFASEMMNNSKPLWNASEKLYDDVNATDIRCCVIFTQTNIPFKLVLQGRDCERAQAQVIIPWATLNCKQ